MTKSEIAEQYEINEYGIITSRGKFENEMYYAVHFWNSVLDGFADEDYEENGVQYAIINLTVHDFINYPELSNYDGVEFLKLWENDNGFVYCEHC